MDQAALPQGGAHGALDRADESGRAVGDRQQRTASPRSPSPARNLPRVGGLTAGGLQPDGHRFAHAAMSVLFRGIYPDRLKLPLEP
ncbi:MAG TPA: hypothetical protein VMU34_05235 [Mycobacterium sp.]|nr:hypothetical protein [Mycobacterium sp.]